MPELTIDLDDDELELLTKHAASQRRSPGDQAAVFIAEAMKCWNPKVSPKGSTTLKADAAKSTPAVPRVLGGSGGG